MPPAFTGTPGPGVLAVSRQHGLEGIVAKRLGSPCQPGQRSPHWRKIKNAYRQEFVAGGWRRGQRSRAGQIGSLLAGVHGPGGLAYTAHIGTGLTQQILDLLGSRLDVLSGQAGDAAAPGRKSVRQ